MRVYSLHRGTRLVGIYMTETAATKAARLMTSSKLTWVLNVDQYHSHLLEPNGEVQFMINEWEVEQ